MKDWYLGGCCISPRQVDEKELGGVLRTDMGVTCHQVPILLPPDGHRIL